jgi:CBS-domain-containing membrane protein
MINLESILNAEQVNALARKAVELTANKAMRKTIKTVVDDLEVNDAELIAVFTLRKLADDYSAKKRVDDAVDTFSAVVPMIVSKDTNVEAKAKSAIAKVCETFSDKNECIAALDKWYGTASANTSDKLGMVTAYQSAVDAIKTFYGPSLGR